MFSNQLSVAATLLFSVVPLTQSFGVSPLSTHGRRQSSTSLRAEDSIERAMEGIREKYQYKAGGAQTEFAARFRHLTDAKVKTVGEAFSDFTEQFGRPINPLYKNMITDLVGTTHLTIVNARFVRSPIWSLGLIGVLDLLLKNYPEPDNKAELVSSFFKSMDLSESVVRQEAAQIEEWAKSVTREEVEAALVGEGSSELAKVAQAARDDPFWLYSRYFGIGLLKIMENLGIEMEKDEAYPIMEEWMNKFGRSVNSACADSDLYFKVREKLDMMETMMKEIEIREKKRMADRLEEKAEAALRAAEREEEWKKEAAKESETVVS